MFKSIHKSFLLLSKKAQNRFKFVLFSVLLINVLDLVAIFMLGSIISLIPQFRTTELGKSVQDTNQIQIGAFEFATSSTFFIISIFGVILMFLLRTYLSLTISRRIFLFLGKKQAEVSANLLGKIQKANYSWLRRQDSQTLTYVVTDGANASIVSVLGQSANLFSEVTLSFLIIMFLFSVKFDWTIILVFAASLLVLSLNRLLANRSLELGLAISDSSVQTRRNAFDAISLFQELRLSKKEDYFLKKFEVNKMRGATAYGRATWIQQFPKYVFEMLVTVAVLTLLLIATQTQIDKESYLIFIVAITRVLPALARINSLVISLKTGIGSSSLVYKMVNELSLTGLSSESLKPRDVSDAVVSDPAHLKVSNVSFSYDAEQTLLEEISFEITPGTIAAFVGPSGAGKSTLTELIAGFYLPTQGEIVLDGLSVGEFIEQYPGGIAYVSQTPYFLAGSILENVALGVDPEMVDEKFVELLLEKAGASQFINALPEGFNTLLTEGGARFSGGQRQRIALARALYTQPRLLILDEATSALDGKTEDLIISSLNSIKTGTTIIIIAHRFATVELADQVNLLVAGRIVDKGKWHEISERNSELLMRVEIKE
jgi:ABC-type multidrug transport system fused ATPase/permease subunit